MSQIALTAKNPFPATILEEYPDGGGLVEIPILRVAKVDLSKTAGGGKGNLDITLADLQAALANFSKWPGPVPINVHPHRPLSETAGASPGFIRALSIRGETLFARIFLCNWLYDEFRRGMWAGFSCDLLGNFKTPTVSLPGMSIAGGVFTNRPATDITFDLKAAAECSADLALPVYLSYQVPSELAASGEEKKMPDEKVASLEAQLSEKESTITALETRNTELSQKLASLEKAFSDLRGEADRIRGEKSGVEGQLAVKTKEASDVTARLEILNGEVRELRERLGKSEKDNLSQKLRRIRFDALRTRDIPSSFFLEMEEGREADWLKEHFVSLEALEGLINSFPKLKRPLSAVEKSGSDMSDPDASNVDPEIRARLRSIGLSADYTNVTDETQLKKK